MKSKINILLAGIALCCLFSGGKDYIEWRSVLQKADDSSGRLKEIADEEQTVNIFKSIPPVKLEDAYQRFVSDMSSGARVYGLGFSIEGGLPLFNPSLLDGLRETRLKVKFSGIPRRGTLVSLLGMLDASAAESPFLAEKIVQDKDTLMAEVVLMGI